MRYRQLGLFFAGLMLAVSAVADVLQLKEGYPETYVTTFQLVHSLHLLFDTLALQGGEIIDKQLTHQMVHFMLNADGQQTISFQLKGVTL